MQLSFEREFMAFNVYLQQMGEVPLVNTAPSLDLIIK